MLWIHPHLGLVSHFILTFLIWFSSNVGVSATANMYKHATLDYIYFLQSISHLYLLFVGLKVMLIFVHYNNSYLLFVGLQGPHCVIIPSQSSYLIKISILRDASGCALKIYSIVGIDTGSKKRLAIELEVDGRRVNEDNE